VFRRLKGPSGFVKDVLVQAFLPSFCLSCYFHTFCAGYGELNNHACLSIRAKSVAVNVNYAVLKNRNQRNILSQAPATKIKYE
jgi:fucose 4-O-acetylase-like acetyltransferase